MATWSGHAEARTWSAKKLDKAMVRIDRDFSKKRWDRVIKYSNKALPHCISRFSERDQRCIILLRNINQSYNETRRFNPDSKQIRQAYELAKPELGLTHRTTMISRDIYYRYLLYKEDYIKAIPLVQEMLMVEENGQQDQWEIYNRTEQLYALYGLTEQWQEEEAMLKNLLTMAETLIGKDSDSYREIVLALAENYCIQKKPDAILDLKRQTDLTVECFSLGL